MSVVKILSLVALVCVALPFSSRAQVVHNVRQWSQLGVRGWPIYQENDIVTILDTSATARTIDINKLTHEETTYIEGLKLPNRMDFEQKLLEGDVLDSVLDKVDAAEAKRKKERKAASEAYSRKARRAASERANEAMKKSKDELAYSKALEDYRKLVLSRKNKVIEVVRP